MTIHLYIQTRHICKGTIQSKLAMRRAVEGGMRAKSQGTRFHRRTGWAAAKEGAGRREVKV